MPSGEVKVVIFDMGGVVFQVVGIPKIMSSVRNVSKSPNFGNVLARMEVGEITLPELLKYKETLISDSGNAETIEKEMTNVSANIMDQFKRDETVIAAIHALREKGFKTALLTNNMWLDAAKTTSMIMEEPEKMFDFTVESCREELRKPDRKIFELAVKRFGFAANECVFLDDLKENCEGAESIGIRTIHVDHTDTRKAVNTLEEILGCKLID